MTLRLDVWNRLQAVGAVTALVGTRVYRQEIPQGAALPYIGLRKVGSPRLQNLEGPTGEEDCRFEVACFGSDAGEAENVAEAVRGAMSGWRDLSVGVHRSDLTGEVDFYDEVHEAHQITLDFDIVHTE